MNLNQVRIILQVPAPDSPPPLSPSQRWSALGGVFYATEADRNHVWGYPPDVPEVPSPGIIARALADGTAAPMADPVIPPQALHERILAAGEALEEERVRIEAGEQIVDVSNIATDRTPTP